MYSGGSLENKIMNYIKWIFILFLFLNSGGSFENKINKIYKIDKIDKINILFLFYSIY